MNVFTDHGGKPSSARAISMMASATFCMSVIGGALGYSEPVSGETLWALIALATGSQFLKGKYEVTDVKQDRETAG